MRAAPCLLSLIAVSAAAVAAQDVVVPRDPFAACAAMPVEKARTTGLELRVKDAAGKPAAGLTVLHYEATAKGMPARRSRAVQAIQRAGGSQVEQVLRLPVLLGKRCVTDAAGVVLLPVPAFRAEVTIVRGRQVLSTFVLGRKPAHEVRLPATSPLHVAVFDTRGAPVAGAPVGFQHESTKVATDGRGRATLSRNPEIPLLVGHRGGVAVDVLTRIPVLHKLDPVFVNTAAKPIRMVLPAHSEIVVEVRKKSGKAIDTVYNAVLKSLDGKRIVSRRAHRGRAVFQVEAGMQALLSCTIAGVLRRQKDPVTAPPPGGRKVVTMTLEQFPSVIDVQLIGLDGEPVRNEFVGLLLLSKDRVRCDEIKTDKRGRLRFNVPDGLFRPTDDVDFRIQRVRLADSVKIYPRAVAAEYLGAYRAPFAAVRQLPGGFALKLEKPKVVLSGRVVDGRGKPVAGVVMSIRENLGGVTYGGGTGGVVYFRRPMVVTDSAGRFAFAELGPPRQKVVPWVRSAHRPIRRFEFPAPATGVEIVVGRIAAIHGSIAGVPADYDPRVTISLAQQGPAGKGRQTRGAGVGKGGAFALPGVSAGTYRVSFSDNFRRPFHTIEGVVVEEGKDCRDPRLQAVDLSRFHRVLTITVGDHKERPLSRVVVRYGKKGRLNSRSTNREGKVTVEVPGVAEVIQVELDGFQAQRFENVRKNLTVRLRRN